MLQLVVLGHSNQEIADSMFLSINSVKTYIRSTYRKIGVTTRAQAIVWAIHQASPPSVASTIKWPTPNPVSGP